MSVDISPEAVESAAQDLATACDNDYDNVTCGCERIPAMLRALSARCAAAEQALAELVKWHDGPDQNITCQMGSWQMARSIVAAMKGE